MIRIDECREKIAEIDTELSVVYDTESDSRKYRKEHLKSLKEAYEKELNKAIARRLGSV